VAAPASRLVSRHVTSRRRILAAEASSRLAKSPRRRR